MPRSQMIDLNADLGEGCGNDAEIMKYISSCNIACGGHTGDETSMREAMQLAKLNHVRIGAHPSYPDKENFGRASLDISATDLEESLRDQLQTIKRVASELGVPIVHVKPHGALYNDAASSEHLSWNIINVSRDVLPQAAIMGPPNSQLQKVAHAQSRKFIAEGFADRRYLQDGTLTPRSLGNAVITEIEALKTQALAMAQGNPLSCEGGKNITLDIDTICLHGDNASAIENAKQVHTILSQNNFTIQAHIHAT